MSTTQYIDIDPQAFADSLLQVYKPSDIKKYVGNNMLQLSDLKIRTKDKRIIPFTPNYIQTRYLDKIFPCWRDEPISLYGLREIILKARQQGLSTLILALFFLDTITVPHTQTVVIADSADNTERLFQVVKRYYETMPEEFRPVAKYANRREYLWPELDSSFYVGTAGTGNYGRGGTVNNVHMSEVSFWSNAEEIVSGLLQSVPESGNVFVECTANGFGNWFQEEWQLTQEKDAYGNPKSSFSPNFFAWFENPEYAAKDSPDTGAFMFQEFDEEEELLIKTFNLNIDQILWRRRKKLELKSKFKQEYPATPEEAFLLSGTPYFDCIEQLNKMHLMLQNKEYAPIEIEIPAEFELLNQHRESLKVWNEPDYTCRYSIGADVAEGVTPSKMLDYDSAHVVNAKTGTVDAILHGQWDTNTFGRLLVELGYWFNTALLGVERNNHGHSVINTVMNYTDYPVMDGDAISGLYLHEEYDRTTRLKNRKAGWPTTNRTKYEALQYLNVEFIQETLGIYDLETIDELMKFVKLPGGKAGAAGKGHDDRVISLSIAVALLNTRPFFAGDPLIGGVVEVLYPKTYEVPGGSLIYSAENGRTFSPPGINR